MERPLGRVSTFPPTYRRLGARMMSSVRSTLSPAPPGGVRAPRHSLTARVLDLSPETAFASSSFRQLTRVRTHVRSTESIATICASLALSASPVVATLTIYMTPPVCLPERTASSVRWAFRLVDDGAPCRFAASSPWSSRSLQYSETSAIRLGSFCRCAIFDPARDLRARVPLWSHYLVYSMTL